MKGQCRALGLLVTQLKLLISRVCFLNRNQSHCTTFGLFFVCLGFFLFSVVEVETNIEKPHLSQIQSQAAILLP